MSNMLSMTAMLIVLSIAGRSHMAADLGIVQAATFALFYSFSGNARSIVLATSGSALAKSIFNLRLILFIPLGLSSFWLSSTLGGVEVMFSAVMILRRTIEWFGEIDLSERERIGDKKFALIYILTQAMLFICAVLWLLLKMPNPLLGFFFWAFIPLLLSASFFWNALKVFTVAMSGVTKKLVPHLGSTIAIGVSLYVFRLLMILILGKSISGDLFAAFAIGGVLGSLTLNAFGPSIAFKEKINGSNGLPKILVRILWIFFDVGLLILVLSFLKPDIFLFFGKELFFWKAIGFSMIGGVIMTHAQLLRSRLLIHNEDHDLFGPDLLMNMLIIAAVPLAYFSLGIEAVAGLSLIGAIMALAFYKSSEIKEILAQNKYLFVRNWLQVLIAIFILMPIYIKMDSGIFLAKEVLTSGGTLISLPIPPSIFLTYLGILAVGSYRSVHLSLSVMFFSFILMFFTTLIITTGQGGVEQAKIILIIQYILPMGALILGEMFKTETFDEDARIERVFLYVLVAIVPLQLAASWLQGSLQLTGYIYIFSIYQHILYVPIVLVSAYLLVLFSLWQDSGNRKILLILSPLMGMYAAASQSLVAMLLLISGMTIFVVRKHHSVSEKLPGRLFAVVLVICLGYFGIEISSMTSTAKFGDVAFETLSSWRLYMSEIFSGLQPLLLGHNGVQNKAIFPGTHNYYLDIARNFGSLAIVPVLVVIGYTIRVVYLARRDVMNSSALSGHVFVLFFLLAIDNSTQVSLRQPYSGIFTFFIWGLLLARLDMINSGPERQV